MHVRMMGQGLTPGVQDGDHSGLGGAKMLRIGGDHADGLRRRLEDEIINDRLVLKCDRRDRRRHREHDMEILDRQQLGLAIGEPLRARQTLALGAMPVAAAVEGNPDRAAVLALLGMAAERCGTAYFDGGHDAALVGREPATLRSAECVSVAAEDIRHLQRGAHMPASVGSDDLNREPIERAGRAGDEIRRNLSVTRRRIQVGVAKQYLNDADVDPAFQKVGGESVDRDRFANPRAASCGKRVQPGLWLFPGQDPSGHVSIRAVQAACRASRALGVA